jgi:hypothetical protein
MGSQHHSALRVPLVALVAALGCGTLGGEDGGGENLPSAGILPYTKAAGDALLGTPGVDFRRPFVLAMGDGSYRMWVARDDAGAGGDAAITQLRSDDGATWQADGDALTADPDGWEQGDIGDPWVVRHGGGFLLYYRGGAGAGIGLATSADGAQWSRHGEAPVFEPEAGWEASGGAPHVASPAVISEAAGLRMWYVGGSGRGVGLASSPDGREFSRESPGPVFEPTLYTGAAAASIWDRDAILSVSVGVEDSATGRPVWRMWYTGARLAASGALDAGIGFAGSFDGVEWVRAGTEPILRDGGLSEKEACEVRIGAERALFFAQFWKKAGTNRHVVQRARFGLTPP